MSKNVHKLKQERSWLDIKKMFSSWEQPYSGRGCPEVVQSPSLEIFKMQLDRALGNLVCTYIEPPLSRRLDWRPPEVPMHLCCSVILW